MEGHRSEGAAKASKKPKRLSTKLITQRLRDTMGRRPALANQAVSTKQHKKHVSLAHRLKLFLLRETLSVTPTSVLLFLEEEEGLRHWNPGSRNTNFGNIIGLMKRGEAHGLSNINLTNDQTFADARKAAQAAAKCYEPKKPIILPRQELVRIVNRMKQGEFKRAAILATISGQRVSDIVQLRYDDLFLNTAIAPDCLTMTFMRGKVVGRTGPFTIGVPAGELLQALLQELQISKELFKQRTEMQRERFEAALLYRLRRIAPGIGLKTFRNSMAEALGTTFATKEEITSILRHTSEENQLKYLKHGKLFYYGQRQAYDAAKRTLEQKPAQ